MSLINYIVLSNYDDDVGICNGTFLANGKRSYKANVV